MLLGSIRTGDTLILFPPGEEEFGPFSVQSARGWVSVQSASGWVSVQSASGWAMHPSVLLNR